jgi:hypothetical protein
MGDRVVTPIMGNGCPNNPLFAGPVSRSIAHEDVLEARHFGAAQASRCIFPRNREVGPPQILFSAQKKKTGTRPLNDPAHHLAGGHSHCYGGFRWRLRPPMDGWAVRTSHA